MRIHETTEEPCFLTTSRDVIHVYKSSGGPARLTHSVALGDMKRYDHVWITTQLLPSTISFPPIMPHALNSISKMIRNLQHL
jgi:hypothetical protein